ncbi:hypothetical protein YTPLAS72_06690 [Nitrospira sp.]|nr:hypothetical protein YTPLAS72_06690 [Nitrospira sp.]
MISDAMRDLSVYRITLFFGPEPVEKKPHTVACVFNVKKRSWKAGIQVAVEIHTSQLLALRKTMALNDRLVAILKEAEQDEVSYYQERAEDVFAQALCRYKLVLRLSSGLTQENQRIDADELMEELNEEAGARTEEIVASIMDELDIIPSCPSSL